MAWNEEAVVGHIQGLKRNIIEVLGKLTQTGKSRGEVKSLALYSIVEMTDLAFLSHDSEPLGSAYRAFLQRVGQEKLFQTAYALLSVLLSDSLSPRRRVLALFILLESSQLLEGVFFSAVQELICAKGVQAELALLHLWQTSSTAGALTPDQVLVLSAKPQAPRPAATALRDLICTKPSGVLSMNVYDCEYLRVMPPMAEIVEAQWLAPGVGVEPALDPDWPVLEQCKAVLQQATDSQVSPAQETELCAALTHAPHLAPQVLTPTALGRLVQRNKSLAAELLKGLAGCAFFPSLLAALCEESSAEAIEVVSELQAAVPVPEEAVAAFVSAHMAHAKDLATEPQVKSFVRKLCLFIERLVRSKLLPAALREEVLTFANEYSRVKEASALYRLICDKELYE